MRKLILLQKKYFFNESDQFSKKYFNIRNNKIVFDKKLPKMISERNISVKKLTRKYGFKINNSLEDGLKKLLIGTLKMLVCKTPFRISFLGGGTDFPNWYNINNGNVISTSINKYSYISLRFLPKLFNYKFRLRYFKTEEKNKINSINHNIFRETIKRLYYKDEILEIVHNSDIPSLSGLASSSSTTVGIVNSLLYLSKKIQKKCIK